MLRLERKAVYARRACGRVGRVSLEAVAQRVALAELAVEGPVIFTAADGYRLTTQNVSINLTERFVTGTGGVSGAIPSGTFSADRVSADLDSRVLMLDGNVRLRIDQTSFRIPR